MNTRLWPPPRPSWMEVVVFLAAIGLLVSGRSRAAGIVVVVGLVLTVARVARRGTRTSCPVPHLTDLVFPVWLPPAAVPGEIEAASGPRPGEVIQERWRMVMIGTIKQGIVGGLVAVALIGGSLAGAEAKADERRGGADSPAESYTVTRGTTTDDGTLIFVCTYDDVTHEELYCDVKFYPSNPSNAEDDNAKPGKSKPGKSKPGKGKKH